MHRLRAGCGSIRTERHAPHGIASGQPPRARGGAALLFRSTAPDGSYGKLAIAALDGLGPRRVLEQLSCERVDFAVDRGVCLTADRGVLTTYAAVVFDRAFRPLFRLGLAGAPSRVRIAPDGGLAAVTAFVSGHSYGGAFSTVTSIIDLRRGEYAVSNFEALPLWDGARRVEAPDRNFWGVTFARDSDAFYATVGSGGRIHLVSGRVRSGHMAVGRAEIECPSLAPDDRRLVFKRRVDDGSGPVHWRLTLLDLQGGGLTPLAEPRSVDDQASWLDERRIMYAVPDAASGSAETTTWVIDADDGRPPRALLRQAASTVLLPAARPSR